MGLRAKARGIVVFVLALTALAQEAPVLENTGKPITLPFHCTEDDMQWAGMSCSEEEPCPVYLELTDVEAIGEKIFATGNLHSDTVTLYAVLLASDDAGKTWREVYERMRGTGLDHIQFADFLNGWVSGETLFPLPQDPFLLFTADGGKTWHRQQIVSDAQDGSVQQFVFQSKNQGSLIVDHGAGSEGERYALYESGDAGETWTLKQMSKRPIPLPRVPEPPEGWRVQADRTTHAFRIEHRPGERWIAAASFSIVAGSCKPTTREAQPPQEPSPDTPAPPRPPGKRR